MILTGTIASLSRSHSLSLSLSLSLFLSFSLSLTVSSLYLLKPVFSVVISMILYPDFTDEATATKPTLLSYIFFNLFSFLKLPNSKYAVPN